MGRQPAPSQAPTSVDALPRKVMAGLRVRSLMPHYEAYLAKAYPAMGDALSPAARRRLFRSNVVAALPGAFAPKVLGYPKNDAEAELDARIDAFVAKEQSLRPALRELVHAIDKQLPKATESFRRALPSFKPTNEVLISLSLGSFDGAGREVDGKLMLIFGLDKIATIHGADANLAALFHHELFHLHHLAQAPKADLAKQELYLALWLEGLAVHVANTLNPKASLNDLVLTQEMVDFIDANLGRESEAFLQVLSSGSENAYGAYFLGRGDPGAGVPKRRGYYLGQLVAADVASRTGMDLERLSRLWGPQLKAEITTSLHVLANRPSTAPSGP